MNAYGAKSEFKAGLCQALRGVAVTIFFGVAAHAKEVVGDDSGLVFYAPERPPFSFTAGSRPQGIFVDLIRELNRVHKKWAVAKIAPTVSGRRAMDAVLRSQTPAFTFLERGAWNNKNFRWVGPVVSTSIVAIACDRQNIQLHSLSDLAIYDAGVEFGSPAEKIIQHLAHKPSYLFDLDRPQNALPVLVQGRLDLWIADRLEAAWHIEQSEYAPEDFNIAYHIADQAYYLAFNDSTPEAIIDEWQAVLDEAVRSDKVHKMVKMYVPRR